MNGIARMKLAIFDIDGTLTDTNRVDDECFIAALAEAHNITEVNANWSAYPHTTDSGITAYIFQERFERAPQAEELTTLKDCFVNLLNVRSQSASAQFCEIPGAVAALEMMRREPDRAVAIATGCWQASAVLKLKVAGIETDGIPAAYAEDGLSREEILRVAVSKALERYGQQRFEKIVSVGDGVWDLRAARRLALAFLGVGRGEAEARLREAGASHVIQDFADYRRLIKCLNEAEIPL
jgi:phosphoglycolate phosphatase-like HAD superfamily hydrolase